MRAHPPHRAGQPHHPAVGEARRAVVAAALQQQPSAASPSPASAARAARSRDSGPVAAPQQTTTTPRRPPSRERRRESESDDRDDKGLSQTTTTRRAALASLGGLLTTTTGGAARAAAAAADSQLPPPQPSLCSLLGLPSGTDDDAAASTSARLLYDGPGPFLALQLPRLEHTCAPCFPASCVGDRCLQQIYVTYPRPLARRADIAAAAAKQRNSSSASTALDPLGAPYPLAVISGGFLLGSDSYASLAARLATWGYVAVRYDRRDGLTDLLDDVSCAELLTDLVAWCSRDPLLRRLADPSRTLLFGHSRGCKIGALAALRLQEEEARERAEEEALMAARGGKIGGRRRAGEEDADAAKCAAVDAAEAVLDAGNAAAEAEALTLAPPPPPATATAPPRKRPRVVGMVCLDPVDTTKYAPESPRFPSALALMRQRAAAEAQARQAEEASEAKEQRGQTTATTTSPPSSSTNATPGIADLPWIILGAAAGTDCAPPGSNYSAWFEQVPGPAVEVVIPGAGHMAFTDPAGGGGGGGGGGADGGGGGGSTSLARSVCSVGTADEAEVRRASMALSVAFAEGVVRRGQGGVLAALAEQRCAAPGGVGVVAAETAPAAEASEEKKKGKKTTTPPKPFSDDAADAVLRSTRQAMERTLAHLRANPGSGGGGSGPAATTPTPPPPPLSAGGLRTRWRGYPSSSSSS